MKNLDQGLFLRAVENKKRTPKSRLLAQSSLPQKYNEKANKLQTSFTGKAEGENLFHSKSKTPNFTLLSKLMSLHSWSYTYETTARGLKHLWDSSLLPHNTETTHP